MPTLKPSYEAFCHAYVTYENAAMAARRAGYSHENANQQGYRMLRRAPIVRLTRSDFERHRTAVSIHQSVDLARQAAARATHATGSAIFFWAQAACW